MNQERYEKARRLAEHSPFEGERAAAREALRRMEAAEARRPPPEQWRIVCTVGMLVIRPSDLSSVIPVVTT